MMLKIKKSKAKISGAVFLALLFCASYIGVSFYSVPEKASAADIWFSKDETRTLADIKYLQDMNIAICENSSIGDKNDSVIDIRDNNAYSIAKLSDNKCWMTQNLRLAGGSVLNRTNTNLDSSVYTSDAQTYTLPAQTTGGFNDTMIGDKNNKDTYMNHEVRNAANPDYGAYYSWCAATAGTCQQGFYADIQPDTSKAGNPTINPIATINVPANNQSSSSICPKGWRLPVDDFQGLHDLGAIKVGTFRDDSITAGFWLGGKENDSDAMFLSAPGSVYKHGLDGTGWHGDYWSSIAYSASSARRLLFDSGGIIPLYNDSRFLGFSVRCIANEKQFPPAQNDTTSGSIAVKVANTLSIDAVSGMEEEVDSTKVSNGAITATIAANTNYKVLLSAEKTSLTSTNTTNTAEIPASATVQAGTNAWGIRNSDNTTYSAITNQEKEYHNTTTLSTNPSIPGTVHTFNIGISVSPSLPADTYSTEVTITAAAA